MGVFYYGGFGFERLENENVQVYEQFGSKKKNLRAVLFIDKDSWISIVASVSAQGNTAEAYNQALILHSNQ